MAVDAVSGYGTVVTSQAATEMKQAAGMNKDDFLKLFVAQLQNQDPLAPQDSSEFVAQLAQLTQVEQSYNTNATLEKMLAAFGGGDIASSAAVIGRQLVADATTFDITGAGSGSLTVYGPEAAQSLGLQVVDQYGSVVFDAESAGVQGVGSFDLTALAMGRYTAKPYAVMADGRRVSADVRGGGQVDGVVQSAGEAWYQTGLFAFPSLSTLGIRG